MVLDCTVTNHTHLSCFSTQNNLSFDFESCGAMRAFVLSFGMAYEFIDSIGNDVDVVSDSEVSAVCFSHCYMLWPYLCGR